MQAGRRPSFSLSLPPSGVSRRSERQVAKAGLMASEEPRVSGRSGKRLGLLIAAF